MNSNGRYVLKGKIPVECKDINEWAKCFEDKNRIIAQTNGCGVRVSTVFLGLDHAFGGGKPLLFETMMFKNGHGDDTGRCSTWDEAETQHRMACEKFFHLCGVLIIWNEERK
jgi:hypothetical protein